MDGTIGSVNVIRYDVASAFQAVGVCFTALSRVSSRGIHVQIYVGGLLSRFTMYGLT